MLRAEERPIASSLLRLHSKLLMGRDGGRSDCRLGLPQLCSDSPTLCQFHLLVQHTGAVSDANPLVCCDRRTPLQRVVGTLQEGALSILYTAAHAPSAGPHFMHMRTNAFRNFSAKVTHLASSKPGTGKRCLTSSYSTSSHNLGIL